jgi:uncharacterized protein (UPF0147 family)
MTRSLKQLALVAAFILSAAFVVNVQAQSKTNVRKPETPATEASAPEENKQPLELATYSYEFTQPDFFVRHIVVQHDQLGRGKVVFERKGEEAAITEPIELSAAALTRVIGGWTELQFLDSTENYQSEKQFPHLGTMRLKMQRAARERTAEFNWTKNKAASSLTDEYRRIADQAILIFDIAVARESQPLNAPKLMEEFETQLKRNGLSDPLQLVSLLEEISTDEHLPLIARNHALRLLKKIDKK